MNFNSPTTPNSFSFHKKVPRCKDFIGIEGCGNNDVRGTGGLKSEEEN